MDPFQKIAKYEGCYLDLVKVFKNPGTNIAPIDRIYIYLFLLPSKPNLIANAIQKCDTCEIPVNSLLRCYDQDVLSTVPICSITKIIQNMYITTTNNTNKRCI